MSQTRKATSLHSKVTELLQAQIAMEAQASATYLVIREALLSSLTMLTKNVVTCSEYLTS